MYYNNLNYSPISVQINTKAIAKTHKISYYVRNEYLKLVDRFTILIEISIDIVSKYCRVI